MSRYAPFFPPDLVTPPTRETFPHAGIDVSVARVPAANAPLTCIVLHGAGGNAELVSPILQALARTGFEAVAPDLPGYGRTATPTKRVRYPVWVEVVRALAEREPRPVALFGLSIGGMLAYHAAAGAPEILGVAATNLLDTADPAVVRACSRNRLAAAATPLLKPAFDDIKVPVRLLAKMDKISNDPALTRACVTDPQGGGSKIPLGFLRTWLAYRPEVKPEDFDRPVLLAHPGADRWTPTATSRPFFDRLAGPTRLVELANCGHAPIEQPGLDTLRTELGAFLTLLTPALTHPAAS